jgi:AdoMet-dependent heme synthase
MDNSSCAPRLIFWELTGGCNLRCIHCRASATELSSPDDLNYEESIQVIDQLTAFAPFILVLSGGEPLFRRDLFQLARRAADGGIRVALATNGTLITSDVARQISESGIRRVAISLDGPDAATHDSFRGIPGAFERAIEGLQRLKQLGISVQINTSVAKHNSAKLAKTLDLALNLGADAFHLFLLVPVGCGVQIAEKQMVEAEEYERILNWLYDQTLENRIELKATCAPHFFRVVRQRRAEARRRGEELPVIAAHGNGGHSTNAMNAMTRGCLAGSGVCFISHKGQVFPCGYLPLEAGNLRLQKFADIWRDSSLFSSLRDVDNLKGKCGACEFRNICEGCRARAFGCSGDYLAEEPFCLYTPRGYQPSLTG